MTIKLSYILPIYNVERYLIDCLDSIYAQNIPEESFEVICVNDCSPDNSREVVLEYQKAHSNLVLIDHTENKKAGGARNTGLAAATGKYVWFVDADDSIVAGAAVAVLKACEKNDLDVLCFNYQLVCPDDVKQEIVFEHQTVVSGGAQFLLDVFGDGLVYHLGFPWRAIYRRELLMSYEIRFPENVLYGEETTCMVDAVLCGKRVMAITDVLYNYHQREQSSSTQLMVDMNGERIYESIFVAGGLVYQLKERAAMYSERLAKAIEKGFPWFVNRLFIRLVRTSRKERKMFYNCLFDKRIYANTHPQQFFAYMDRRNSLIVRYPLLGKLLLDVLSAVYKITR
jgi:glycosyltransferase involved in cell wall biosynthesis